MKRITSIITWMLIAGTVVLLAHTFRMNIKNAQRIDAIKQEIQASEAKHTDHQVFDRIKQILND
jgi:hypothetical protein